MKKHLLQSEAWGEFEKREGKEVFHRAGANWEFRASLERTRVGNYLFVKYGPSLVTKTALPEALAELRVLAREKKAVFVRVEPVLRFLPEEMSALGLKKTKNIDPEHTWVLDLTQTEEEILAGMEKSTVKFWRNYEKKGMRVRKTQEPAEIEKLMPFLTEVAGKRGFGAEADAERLKKQVKGGFATLYFAEIPVEGDTAGVLPPLEPNRRLEHSSLGRSGALAQVLGPAEECSVPTSATGCPTGATPADSNDGSPARFLPIAGSLVYDYGGVRYTVHSGSDYEHRKLRPSMVLTVTKILDAKRAGMKKYDFWGITTSTNPKHPWYGFTQHKKSFGGGQVDYSGTYDLPVRKFRYLIYSMLRAINLKMRRARRKLRKK